MQRPIRIGTRGSPLALYQARLVQSQLADHLGLSPDQVDHIVPIHIFRTSGDKLKGELSQFGGKGLFTKELEDALLSEDVDIAVHSMKDVPTVRQDGLVIGAILKREDPRDAFISPRFQSLADLPQGALIGTASLRRRAQLSHTRRDIQFSLLRGNVGTRLEKLDNGDCDGTFLALAGLKRLEQTEVISEIIEPDIMLNAPAQGAIGIEARENDDISCKAIEALNHASTHWAVSAERAFLKALDGSCRTPIAALAVIKDNSMQFRGEVLSTDGSFRFSRDEKISIDTLDDCVALGRRLGLDIKSEIGDRDIWNV